MLRYNLYQVRVDKRGHVNKSGTLQWRWNAANAGNHKNEGNGGESYTHFTDCFNTMVAVCNLNRYDERIYVRNIKWKRYKRYIDIPLIVPAANDFS